MLQKREREREREKQKNLFYLCLTITGLSKVISANASGVSLFISGVSMKTAEELRVKGSLLCLFLLSLLSPFNSSDACMFK